RADMQSTMNLKVKFRESFRPFAPAVMAERAAEHFELEGESPYMLLTAPVKAERQLPMDWSTFDSGDMYPFSIRSVAISRQSRMLTTVHACKRSMLSAILISSGF
ncbi:MAG TPA: carbamoyltransferase C-terminal domain-containing protein, partial [Pirellulaceae bacterium]|nr:carbamoyltransferase C-terminal domain-containing protein [Pirellulaceae bacterium]